MFFLRNSSFFIQLLKWIASLTNFACKNIPVEPQKTSGVIIKIFGYTSLFVCVCLDAFGFNIVIEGINLLQTKWIFLCGLIVFIATLPPVAACFERKKAASWKYIGGNWFFNWVGAGCACALLYIAYMTIENFNFLKEFYVADIAILFVPLCLWISFSYQHVEQEKEKMESDPDHSASLRWINQILNVLHLINVYFWSLVSAELIVCYTLYCYIHHAPQKLSIRYLLALSLVLFFFYLCGIHKHEHLYLLFLAAVPAILICTVQWMSWFIIDDKMVGWQLVFIIVHFGLYMLVIYLHEKRRPPKKEKQKLLTVLKGWIQAVKEDHKRLVPTLGNWFFFVVFIILVISYIIFWIVPSTLVRVPYSEAVNHICAICEDPEKPESLLNDIKESEWYDDTVEKPDIDKTHYLLFIYDNLRDEMIEKNIITESATTVSYQTLKDWYSSYDGEKVRVKP